MTAIATQKPRNLNLESLSIDELVDVLRGNQEYLDYLAIERAQTENDRREVKTMIELRMEEKGSRLFERAGYTGAYELVKSGSATLLSPAIAKVKLEELDDVPQHAIDDVFKTETPAPYVKGDLRKFRKLAAYSAEAAAIVATFISEPVTFEQLVIKEIPPAIKNVTPEAVTA
jgi:hypothetical protein